MLCVSVLRINYALAALVDDRLAGLIHGSVAGDAAARHRHERFLVSRLATGALAMAALPPFLLWRGVPSGLEAFAIASLFLPVCAAVLLSRTGSLWLAHAVSSAGLTGLIVCLAAMTGGAQSAATIWLAVIPFEAVMSGSRRATIAGVVVAALGAAAIALSGTWAAGTPLGGLWADLAMPAFALTAIGHVAAQAISQMRIERRWRSQVRTVEMRDRVLLSAIDDLVTWHDHNGRVLDASGSAAKFVGLEATRLRGHGLLDRVHVADRPAFLQAISDVAARGVPATVPFRLHLEPRGGRTDGPQIIHAEMRAHRIEGEPGSAAAVVAVTRDVTEHRRRADELEAARAEAERADEVKSRFLANVSHELRTPLNAIIGFSEILAGEGAMRMEPAQAREYAGIVGNSGRHLLEVVNTLLDMSRIQSGHFEYAPEPIDAACLLTDCCDLIQLKAKAAGVALVRQPSHGPVALTADARACRQIVINLLSNAVKFTPAGGRVEIGLRRRVSQLDIVVADTGAGIAEVDLPRIGTPFFQGGDGGYRRSHEGTGLGLSVVQGLVGLHGGFITLESAPGVGTVVTVTLPLDCRPGSAGAPAAPIAATVLRDAPVTVLAELGARRRPMGLFDEMPPASVRLAG